MYCLSRPGPRNPQNRPEMKVPGPPDIVGLSSESIGFRNRVGGPVGHPQGFQVKTFFLNMKCLPKNHPVKPIFNFFLAPSPPPPPSSLPRVPGDGPDCHFPKEIGGCWAAARIRGVIYFISLVLAQAQLDDGLWMMALSTHIIGCDLHSSLPLEPCIRSNICMRKC